MEAVIVSLFAVSLACCVSLGLSLVYAMAFGYALFFCYGLSRKTPPLELLRASLQGVRSVKTILALFLLIGMMTSLWRSSGTIPAIIGYSSRLIHPSAFLLMAFLLNCLVSVLTGTAFGTVATMGVICMSIAQTLGVHPAISGGAILSGIFFGDRCSPVSTSALLVAELTDTDIYANIRNMIATSLVPFLLTCGIYAAAGLFAGQDQKSAVDIEALFSRRFSLGWATMIPAAAILILSFFRVNVKFAMGVSIASAAVVSLAAQNAAPAELLRSLLWGYRSPDPALAALLDGGGIASMATVAAIVTISSSYSGLFEATRFLAGMQAWIERLRRHTTAFGAILVTSVLCATIAFSQTLTILLTHQLCGGVESNRERFALYLEDSAVVVAPLIPWSIAAAVPLATINAPAICVAAASYLYLLPLWNLLVQGRRRAGKTGVRSGEGR